jgi:hypothetical protein|tara:strand:- start:441 stop:590 length:150 start_codon:yes stop_codon:yes gene_type:complete
MSFVVRRSNLLYLLDLGAAYDVRFAGLLVSSGDAVAETAIAKTTGTGNN